MRIRHRWIAIACAVVALFAVAAWLSNATLSRIARDRVIQGLRDGFASDLEFKSLNVNVFPRPSIVGEGIVLHYKGRRDLPPLISIRRFSSEGGFAALLFRHVRRVQLEGLEIQIPPKQQRAEDQGGAKKSRPGRIDGFVIDEVIADGTVLRRFPKDPEKQPLEWDLGKLTLHGAGPSSPMSFRATLTNAKPPGDIETTGKFGPWAAEEPGDTPLEGNYTFRNADLSVFKGISGKLSSDGSFKGTLDSIEAQGKTDTPDFMVKIGGNPVHLKTQFHAIIDGTDRNTTLQPVEAQFNHSTIVARGSVEGVKGRKGKTVSLDVTVDGARLEDMLLLGVKGRDPSMTGVVSFRTKLVIPPGDIDVAEKMKLDGEFTVASAHFSKLDIQEKVNKLSHSGQGKPEEPATDSVASDFKGRFKLDSGKMTFQSLSFRVPGVMISLDGTYGLLDEKIDFHGTATLEAKLSQTTTGFKSVLLKAVDPFFEKKKAGAMIPIHISGTREKPAFGLDLR